ncbi:hypothetical protein MMC27_003366 [Xylographa pallens]|nr:hypothetical protein [Xylographa pallens]
MTPECTDSDEGGASGYDGDREMGSGEENQAESQSALGSINEEKGGQQDSEELGEEIGGQDGEKEEEPRGEEGSDDDFPPELRECMPLEDDGAFEAEEETFRDSLEIEGYGPEPEDENEEYGWGGFGSESEDGG